jgi:putative DNA primase/helicase
MKTLEAAKGKWKGILMHFGIAEAFLQNRHMACPLCGGKDRFRYDDKDGAGSYFCSQCGAGSGIKLLMQYKGWDFKTAAAEIDKVVGNVQATQAKPAQDPSRRINLIAKSLQDCSLAVRQYLANRNLKACKGVKSARVEYYEEGKAQGEYECMVCPIQNKAGDVISYHVTYLQDGYKAKVKSPKKMLSPLENMNGSAIRLTDVYSQIGLAEGIETALAVMEIYKMPCWAAASAGMMEAFQPPEGVKTVIIFADHDANFTGQKAAYTLANRLSLAGYTTGVFVPNEVGDYADALKPKSVQPHIEEAA